jgi:orotidine-5'-phosphate decarboxylase
MEPKDRLIVALDLPSLDEALHLADRIAPHIGLLKIGLELFSRCGPDGVQLLAQRAPIMLDLKLHDIPVTVARAARAIADLDVAMATIHAEGGSKMMRHAADAAPQLKLLGVTVLTSLDQAALAEVGLDQDIRDIVAKRASLAVSSGCAGVVASPREASLLRRLLGPGPLIVTPGIRPAGTSNGDQKRTATPRAAIASGVDHVVIGRPIRDAPDPVEAIKSIVDDIAAGLEG